MLSPESIQDNFSDLLVLCKCFTNMPDQPSQLGNLKTF